MIVYDLSLNFIKECKDRAYLIDVFKIKFLLYIAQGISLARYNIKMFEDKLVKTNGDVLFKTLNEKRYGSVTTSYTTVSLNFTYLYDNVNKILADIKIPMPQTSISVIEEVVEKYGHCTKFELYSFIRNSVAYKKAYFEEEIDIGELKKEFQGLVNVDVDKKPYLKPIMQINKYDIDHITNKIVTISGVDYVVPKKYEDDKFAPIRFNNEKPVIIANSEKALKYRPDVTRAKKVMEQRKRLKEIKEKYNNKEQGF